MATMKTTMPPFTAAEELVELLNTVHDEGTARHFDSQSDETLTECKVCGEWESHTEICPIPAIERWLKS